MVWLARGSFILGRDIYNKATSPTNFGTANERGQRSKNDAVNHSRRHNITRPANKKCAGTAGGQLR